MIKKLQRKFVVITMVSLLAVLLLVVGGINGLNIYQITGKSDILLEMLIENEGSFPKQGDKGNRPPGLAENTIPKNADSQGTEGKDPDAAHGPGKQWDTWKGRIIWLPDVRRDTF